MRAIVAGILLVVMLSGCVGEVKTYYASFEADSQYMNPGVFEGVYQYADANGSNVLRPGWLKRAEPEVYHLLSEHPADVGAAAESDESPVYITMAVWKPVNLTGPLPLIVDAGPYYEQGSLTIDRASQTVPFLLKNFLPYGYAVAQVAVRGTGTSGGCMELMGPRERDDLSQAITWLAEQPWSNGNVGMIGVSYDGSTPWEVAATGNPHLKTIVPISGLPDVFDLMFRNGSAESRGPTIHQAYWTYGFDKTFPTPDQSIGGANGRQAYQNRQNLICPEAWQGLAAGYQAWATGDRGPTEYWKARDHRDDVLSNYKGSVFLIHGLQDWNVDPHAVVPFNLRLREAGLTVKEWYGQWVHANPDSLCFKDIPRWLWAPCRLDYAEVLLHWFDRYLKGNASVDTGPLVQVQDNRGVWRNADQFPPSAPRWLELRASNENKLVADPGAATGSFVLMPPDENGLAMNHVDLVSAPFTQDVHISGMPQLHVAFESMGPGGFVSAWLFDEAPDGRTLGRWIYDANKREAVALASPPIVGHGQMDLRYHDGGETADPVAPGERGWARMELEPLDIHVPQGHRLRVRLFQLPYPDHANSVTPSPARLLFGGSDGTVLRLPTYDYNPYVTYSVPGSHFSDAKFFTRYDVDLPAFEDRLHYPLDAAPLPGHASANGILGDLP